MKRLLIIVALALALMASACAGDVAESDEYQALELEVAALEQQLSEAQRNGNGVVPAEAAAVLEEWWAANERGDGSVVDLYTDTGYHLYGDLKIPRDRLTAHFGSSVNPEWITDPFLIVADQSRGRYVVTRGVRVAGFSSALTFEILTTTDGDLRITQTDWTHAH